MKKRKVAKRLIIGAGCCYGLCRLVMFGSSKLRRRGIDF